MDEIAASLRIVIIGLETWLSEGHSGRLRPLYCFSERKSPGGVRCGNGSEALLDDPPSHVRKKILTNPAVVVAGQCATEGPVDSWAECGRTSPMQLHFPVMAFL